MGVEEVIDDGEMRVYMEAWSKCRIGYRYPELDEGFDEGLV